MIEFNLEKLKECYKKIPKKGVFLSEIGEDSGNFGKILEGKRNITIKTLLKIANKFDKPISYFFDDEDGKNSIKQKIIGDNNVQTGNNSNVDARRYCSDSIEVLLTQIDEKDRLIAEKEERIKEKDAQIKEKDGQINKLLSILSK